MSDSSTAAGKRKIPPYAQVLILGASLLGAGLLIHSFPFQLSASGVTGSYTVPQWNYACTSGAGQIWQALSTSAQSDCGYIATADHAIGWLIGGGIAALVLGFAMVARGLGHK